MRLENEPPSFAITVRFTLTVRWNAAFKLFSIEVSV